MNECFQVCAILGTSRPGSYTGFALNLIIDEMLSDNFPEISSVEVLRPSHINLGFPDTGVDKSDARMVQNMVSAADGLIFATPEYHGSFAAMTKLIIENLGFPSAIKDKPVALLGCAAGQAGAKKALEHLSITLSHIGALPLEELTSIGNVRKVFDKHGYCIDHSVETQIRNVSKNLVDHLVNR